MTLRKLLLLSLGITPRVVTDNDPHGINAALADRKAHRLAYRALERSEAARKGWQTRRAQA